MNRSTHWKCGYFKLLHCFSSIEEALNDHVIREHLKATRLYIGVRGTSCFMEMFLQEQSLPLTTTEPHLWRGQVRGRGSILITDKPGFHTEIFG